jgi:hypothetical protein
MKNAIIQNFAKSSSGFGQRIERARVGRGLSISATVFAITALSTMPVPSVQCARDNRLFGCLNHLIISYVA